MQVEMMRTKAVKEEPVKFVFFGKLLYASSQILLALAKSEEVYKFKEHSGDCIVPHTNHAFNSYFHTNVVLRFILCRLFHPLADKFGIVFYKGDNSVMVFGVRIAYTTTLHYLQGFQ